MRIIAGRAGRTRLETPRGLVRPTSDRVREALFSIIGERVTGARVLDLFAGSGALGLEALSRGAAAAVFVDESAEACRTISRNIERARFEGEEATVRRSSAEIFLKRAAREEEPYGLIFADPPYRTGGLEAILRSGGLCRALDEGGWLVLEMAAKEKPEIPQEWSVADERLYGGTKILILTQAEKT